MITVILSAVAAFFKAIPDLVKLARDMLREGYKKEYRLKQGKKINEAIQNAIHRNINRDDVGRLLNQPDVTTPED